MAVRHKAARSGAKASEAGSSTKAIQSGPEIGAIAAITTRGINAQKAFQGSQNPAVTLPDLLAGLTAVRALRAGLGAMGLTDLGKYEIDFRLAQKETQFQQAIVLAHGLRMDAVRSTFRAKSSGNLE